MLILSRMLGQRIVIDGQVWVTVHSISPGRIELAFEAPRHIDIDREEIFRSKEQGLPPPASKKEPQS